jgi:D-arabinan exo alpha-(1,3)/(1,5)-arabinofuranosidase (non-reducing end)
MELGTFDLKADGNRFSVKVVGANDKAIPAYMFGLDYLLLKPVE